MNNETEDFVKVCKLNDLKENAGRKFLVDDVEIAVFKVEGRVYALQNSCPHQHAALIYDGFIEDGYIICPAHGWEFNLKDGKMKTGRKGLDSYEVKTVGDYVFVNIIEKKLNW